MIVPMLDRGERLLWSGQPQPGDFAFEKGWWPSLCGLIFVGASAWAAYHFYQEGWPQFLASCGFALAGLCLVLAPVWEYHAAKHTIYAVTDRRVLTVVSGFSPWRRSVPLHQIESVEVRPSIGQGVSSLYFERTVMDADGPTTRRDGFVAITNAGEVERIMRRALVGRPQ